MGNDNGTTTPGPGVNADQIIEDAVRKAIKQFEHEHPATYKVLVKRIENPVELIIETLKRDAHYQQLVTETDEAVDLARIIVGIAEVALKVVERFLPLL